MNIDNIVNTMGNQIDKASNNINDVMNNMTTSDPLAMVKMQYAMTQYSVMVDYESSMLKAIKDMMMNIITKIG